ncbi:hypothetical protein [Methylobacter sp. BBA5.1]|uniref:hypothetical protein n=1 Tax=Methylobacter sp. BBA5.1 TaxID=1495064 RepID=UPI000561323F|nr:hypothetical protein [Methylobacter sp. BBA5.1]
MALFQGVLFLCLGAGLLLVDYRALGTGWLPCGPNGFKGRLEVSKDKQPTGFWLMFLLYGLAGLWLVLFSLQLLLGQAEPLPLS